MIAAIALLFAQVKVNRIFFQVELIILFFNKSSGQLMNEDRVEDTCVLKRKNEVYLNGGFTWPTSTLDLNMKDVGAPRNIS